MTRVAVFIDYQNAYKGARESFGLDSDHFTSGQIFPRRLGLLLTDRNRHLDAGRTLERVEVFRGEPSTKHSPKGQAAAQRQRRYWEAQERVHPCTRPLKYYPSGYDAAGNRRFSPREKGIDVLIALHMVMGAMRNEYDVAVLMSGDTDLLPAVETVIELGKVCEVASWTNRFPLKLRSRRLWCHWLQRKDYDFVADPTDYTMPQGPPQTNP